MAARTSFLRYCGRSSILHFVLLFSFMNVVQVESYLLSNQPACAGRWACRGGFQCIEYSRVCDGIIDCALSDDEAECSCTSDADCPEEATCVAMDSSRKVCKRKCRRGFISHRGRCVDENECSSGNHTCSITERCINTVGSFRCDCPPGYARNLTTNDCHDIDECNGPDAKCTSPLCENTPGNFRCPCPEHTEPSRSFDPKLGIVLGCSETNYCLNSSCDAHRVCRINVQTKDKYECVCAPGFREQNGTCVDIDECLTMGNVCDRVVRTSENRLRCSNFDGHYACRCPQSTKAVVVDNHVYVDKCKLTDMFCPEKKCPPRSICRNGICICQEGFHWKGGRCVDFDECTSEAHDCPDDMICENESPLYTCRCRPGFRLKSANPSTTTNGSLSANNTASTPGTQCVDIDECAEGLAECEHTCENNIGSYNCHCSPGNVRIDRYCYPLSMPRQIIQFERNMLRFGTLGFSDLSIGFENYNHSCDAGSPSGLAYDQNHRRVFYLSSDRSKIFQDDHPGPCKILVSGRSEIAHIAVDYEFQNLYWIENNGLYVKSVLSGYGRLLREFNETFRSMMLDPAESYAALVGEQSVYKVDLDGSRVQSLYEFQNISRIFLDADGSPIYLVNETLLSCPTMGTPIEECAKLNISASNKRVLGVHMNFIILINEKNYLEVVSENTRSRFELRMQYSDDALFEVVQNSKRVNSTKLCRYCDDICLNSGTTLGRCSCSGIPCSLTEPTNLKALLSFMGWEGPVIALAVALTVALTVIVSRVKRQAKPALDMVGFDSNSENIVVEPPQTITPCIDVPMKSQLIEN